jgi:hypothetical protein
VPAALRACEFSIRFGSFRFEASSITLMRLSKRRLICASTLSLYKWWWLTRQFSRALMACEMADFPTVDPGMVLLVLPRWR